MSIGNHVPRASAWAGQNVLGPTALDPTAVARLWQLKQGLAAPAEAAGLLDVGYRTLDTPVGRLLLAATVRGLVRVAYLNDGRAAVLQDLADRVGPRILHAPARLDAVAHQLEQYFTGSRRRFTLPLDRRLARGFQATVLRHVADIGYGQTASYATLAERTGSPGAARAVGTACATNPLPIIVPCHRVIRADGRAGGYIGGATTKRALLTLEAATE